MKDDLHAQTFGQYRQLGADGAVAHNTQGLAANLKGVVGAFLPATTVGHGVLFGNAAQQQNRLAQHQLGHRTGVGEGRVEHHNAALTRSVQIDLIGANAKAAYGHQLVRGGKHFLGQLRARADTDKVRIGNLCLQLLALQRAAQRFYIGVARVMQHFQRRGVNALQQQKFDLRLVQRCLGHVPTLRSVNTLLKRIGYFATNSGFNLLHLRCDAGMLQRQTGHQSAM